MQHDSVVVQLAYCLIPCFYSRIRVSRWEVFMFCPYLSGFFQVPQSLEKFTLICCSFFFNRLCHELLITTHLRA